MSWKIIIEIVMFLLGKLKDSDLDGRPDVFDKFPDDKDKK